MDHAWQFQLRLTASEALAPELRSDPSGHAYAPLHEVLQRHGAQLVCQYDAFAGYVSEAEKEGVEKYPLYQWTKDTIENPAKQAKYLKSFTVYVKGDEVYGKDVADALERELLALVNEGSGIERVAKFDTNPANNPQPPQR
ncbi:hypothetical protein [Paraburkholderia kururiensis]|uniref:hypothetical protein n=1 Tax=Paraburkholderia kururiensis TaxID=984307 RepID=UPI0018F2D6F1|nr:hypothetical protein [Paraburkholderia kururiensis]